MAQSHHSCPSCHRPVNLAAGACVCGYRWAVPAASPVSAPVSSPVPDAASAQVAQLQRLAKQWEQHIAKLRTQAASIEDNIEMQSFGVYQPRYNFDRSSTYAQRLKDVRERLGGMIKRGDATYCDTPWTVSGSAAEGKKMVDRMSRLMLRAFNGECDVALKSVKYDNAVKMEERIRKSCEAINKLGHSSRVMITNPYFQLRVEELHLVHEHALKVQEEKEIERQRKRDMAEEQRAEKELEKAQKDAEKQEAKKEAALTKARKELESAQGAQLAKLEALVSKLETELSEAVDRKAKAIARAQLTKSGHVYVLSNIGSFGSGIYKIGMTRRLEPLERVHELGDASVPFKFDVHAMIYTENAPQLETALHQRFAGRRVNLVNLRREYFRVSLEEIMTAVGELHGQVTFVTQPEAEEYRLTQATNAAQAE